MKKVALSSVVVLAFLIYAFHQSAKNTGSIAIPNKNSLTGNLSSNNSFSPDVTTPSPALSDQSPLTPTDAPDKSTSVGLKDGTYTGDVANAFYGNLQVQAIINRGKISDIKFLVYPQDRGHTIEVSNYSLPVLKSEAIQSQSAQVDIVTGATQTSEAFTQSLQSALNQAKG